MKSLGKLMQVAGLVMLPLGMLLELIGALPRSPVGGGFTLASMLLMMLFGFAIFSLGRYVEGYGELAESSRSDKSGKRKDA